jgi:hypothetical protein
MYMTVSRSSTMNFGILELLLAGFTTSSMRRHEVGLPVTIGRMSFSMRLGSAIQTFYTVPISAQEEGEENNG